jgi:hypothetical protein
LEGRRERRQKGMKVRLCGRRTIRRQEGEEDRKARRGKGYEKRQEGRKFMKDGRREGRKEDIKEKITVG